MKRTNKKPHYVSFFAGFLLVIFASCDYSYLEIEKLPDFHYGPVFAVPLANASLGLAELVPDSKEGLIRTGNDKLLSLVYKNSLFSATGQMLFPLPNQQHPANFTASPIGQNPTAPITRTFSFITGNNDRLDSLTFLTGDFFVAISVPNLAANGYQAMVTLSIPGSYNSQGQGFTMQVPANGNARASLQGFTIPFYSSGSTHNLFDVRFIVTFSGAGTPTNAPYTFNINHNFSGLSLKKMFGVLAQRTLFLGGMDTDLGIFSSSFGGNISFEDPRVRFIAINSFGIPVLLTANTLRFSNATNQVSLTGFPSPWAISAPAINQFGQHTTTSLVLTRQNSNVHLAAAISPVNLHSSFTTTLNQGGSSKSFVADNSRLELEVELELPLWGSANDFILKETMNIGKNDSITEIEWIELRIELVNHFAVALNLQVEFADMNMVVQSKLWDNVADFNLMDAAQVDAQGNVTAPRSKITNVMLNQQQTLAFLNSENLIITARLKTPNSGQTHVKFFSDQKLDVRIGARLKGKKIIGF